MSTPEQEESFDERRRRLTAQIARQRAEFSQAYTKLEQPIRYTEYGMRGFGFLRSNPWIFAAVPSAISVVKMLVGGGSPKGKKIVPAPAQVQAQDPNPKLAGFRKTLSTVVSSAWSLFQLYRQIRAYLP